MEENEIGTGTTVSPESNKKKNLPFMIFFIIGCVFAIVGIIVNIFCAITFFSAWYEINNDTSAALGGAISGSIMIIVAIPSAIDSVIAMVLTGLGIKWNKIAGSVVLSVIGLTFLLMAISFLMFVL